MCFMHVSFCVSSGGGDACRSDPISDIPFKYPLTDTEWGEQRVEVGGGDGGARILISACYGLLTEDGGRSFAV